jgi:Asp-tRNA(Asn)/Glu-tRNA(Gln) amidotransferase A subunit family amidase
VVLREVGHILLQLPFMDVRQPRRFLIADDCFNLSIVPNEHSLGAVIRSVQRLLGRQVLHHVNLGEFVATNLPSLKEFGKELSGGTHLGSLDLLRTAMQLLQRWEFKTNHEEWLVAVKPELGSNTSVRVQAALDTSLHLVPLVQKVREEAQFAINELLKNDTLLVLPTAPSIPPKLNTSGSTLEDFRNRAFSLLSVAGMSGCCQVWPCCNYLYFSFIVSLPA